MAERRPLTARDIKSNVEGYQEMSDEAFARRFYSDRAELVALGVPLDSQRDEFTGEELYTLRSERYFLPRARARRRRARRAADVLLPARGPLRVRRAAAARAAEPRARPLGRARSPPRRPAPPSASRCATPTTRPSCRAASASSRARSRSSARSSSATGRSTATRSEERTLNPYALLPENGSWYVIGHDLERDDIQHVPRLAHPLRHPLRDAARARLPPAARVRRREVPRPRRMAVRRHRRRGARSRSRPTPPGGSSAPTAASATASRATSS